MIASSPTPGGGWTWVVAITVFVAVLAVLAVDRVRLQRRSAAREAAAALLRTDLADARREIAMLRDCLRDSGAAPGVAIDPARAPGDPNAPVG